MSKAEELILLLDKAIEEMKIVNDCLYEISGRAEKLYTSGELANGTPPFVRLTDEEIREIVGLYSTAIGGYTRKLFDEIQDRLEEKNK